MVIKARCLFVAGCDSFMNLVGLEVLSLFLPLHNKLPSVLNQIVFLYCRGYLLSFKCSSSLETGRLCCY